ncbi:MAG: hypothetical protein QN206_01375 [Armatimonadota bacterium]|nr:hypothetical protein [Armatimonadota bacterium]
MGLSRLALPGPGFVPREFGPRSITGTAYARETLFASPSLPFRGSRRLPSRSEVDLPGGSGPFHPRGRGRLPEHGFFTPGHFRRGRCGDRRIPASLSPSRRGLPGWEDRDGQLIRFGDRHHGDGRILISGWQRVRPKPAEIVRLESPEGERRGCRDGDPGVNLGLIGEPVRILLRPR